MLSCVLIIPAKLKDKANELLESFGWGSDSFSVVLGDTHYGCHTWLTQDSVDLISQSHEGYEEVNANLIISVRGDYTDHLVDICTENNIVINNQ